MMIRKLKLKWGFEEPVGDEVTWVRINPRYLATKYFTELAYHYTLEEIDKYAGKFEVIFKESFIERWKELCILGRVSLHSKRSLTLQTGLYRNIYFKYIPIENISELWDTSCNIVKFARRFLGYQYEW